MNAPSSREPRLYERVASELRTALANGRYPVGSRLPSERDLAAQFKVSRPTVREAVIALEAEGRVEVRTNSGVYAKANSGAVATPGESGVGGFDVLEARRLIEPQVAALAASQIKPQRIEYLRTLVEKMEQVDRRAATAADREFHLEIARATGNSAFEPILVSLWDARDQSLQYMRLEAKARAAGINSRASEHLRIVDALAAGDAPEARQAMWDHLTRVIETLLTATEVDAVERARAEVEQRRRRFTTLPDGAVFADQ